MERNRLCNLIKYDLRAGILSKKYRVIIMICFFVIVCGFAYEGYSQLVYSGQEFNKPGFMDYIIYIYYGMNIYDPSANEVFQIPLIWMTMHLFLAYLVGSYPVNNFYGQGVAILIRARNRQEWWISKCIWLIVQTMLYYGMFLLIVGVFSIITGGIGKIFDKSNIMSLYGVLLDENKIGVYICIFIMTILTSLTLGIVQMVLMFLSKPIIGYILVSIILVISCFYCSPFFIGNYAMYARYNVIAGEGVEIWQGVLVVNCIIISAFVIGLTYLKRIDILKKGV